MFSVKKNGANSNKKQMDTKKLSNDFLCLATDSGYDSMTIYADEDDNDDDDDDDHYRRCVSALDH